MDRYLIIKVEPRLEYGIMIVKANKVEYNKTIYEEYGRKKYFVSCTETDKTNIFIVPFTESYYDRLGDILRKSWKTFDEEDLWLVNEYEFLKTKMIEVISGVSRNIFKHRNLYKLVTLEYDLFPDMVKDNNIIYTYSISSNIIPFPEFIESFYVLKVTKYPFESYPMEYPKNYEDFIIICTEEEKDNLIIEYNNSVNRKSNWDIDLQNYHKEEVCFNHIGAFDKKEYNEILVFYISNNLELDEILDVIYDLPYDSLRVSFKGDELPY